jgi:rSAM/selenodomain-associated transferase 2
VVSVIVIAFNEAKIIEATLQQLDELKNESSMELIVVDGGSVDATVELSKRYARVLSASKGKANQLNTGAMNSNGDILFFVHADVIVPKGAIKKIVGCIYGGYDGGGISNTFDHHNEKIKRLGRLLNLRIWNNDHERNLTFFGDNGIFVKKSIFETIGGFRNIPIMEDYDFSTRLRRSFKAIRIKDPLLVVSARRHEKAGFVKTRIQWVFIKWLYRFRFSPKLLARWYSDVR